MKSFGHDLGVEIVLKVAGLKGGGGLLRRLRAERVQGYPKTPKMTPKGTPWTTQTTPKTPKMAPNGPIWTPKGATDRPTDRQADRPTDRPTDRWTDRTTDGHVERPTVRQTPTDRWIDRSTDRQADRPTDRQADRPTDPKTDRPTDRHNHQRIVCCEFLIWGLRRHNLLVFPGK